jgi:tetratricopeptide (TPR) repeat protein
LLSIVARPGDTSAVRHFVLGSAAADHGRVNEARAHLRAAKERDALRFRAPEAINQIIREEAARAGATVVESQQAIERASPLGIPGRTLILEHLHPNVAGYAIIADAFYDALRTRGLPARTAVAAPTAAPAAPPGATPRDLPVTAVDSLAGIYRVGRLTAQWPFQPRGTSVVAVVDTLRPRTPAEQLAQALVRGELPWAAATDQLRQAYERAGDADAAIRVALVMAQEFPYTPQPYMDASRIALAHGRYADGHAFARHALARRETPEAAQLVGLLALRLGDRTGALAFLDRAAELAPGDQRMTVPRDAARALPDLEAARAATPRDTLLLYDLAAAYALTHLYDRARTTLAELQRLAPAHAGARDLLRRLPPP